MITTKITLTLHPDKITDGGTFSDEIALFKAIGYCALGHVINYLCFCLDDNDNNTTDTK